MFERGFNRLGMVERRRLNKFNLMLTAVDVDTKRGMMIDIKEYKLIGERPMTS